MALLRGLKVLLAASALALLSGCIVVTAGGVSHPHRGHRHQFHDHAPRWGWHAPPGHRHHRHFRAPGHHWPRFHHHRRHRR